MIASTKAPLYRLVPPYRELSVVVASVTINIHLNASIELEKADRTFSGGLVFFFASSDDARKNVDARRKASANLTYWCLQSKNMEPLPRLCMCMDVFGETCRKATNAQTRFRNDVTYACQEVASLWDAVEPPDAYDGPNWR